MIFVGIDVASTKHDCFIINRDGEVLQENFTFQNDLKGYKKLQHILLNVMESSADSNMRIGLESTGLYHLNLMNFLTVQGFLVQEINPLLTSMTAKSSSLRKTKTDSLDSEAICTFLYRNQFNFKPHTLKLYNTEALKSLSRYRFSLVEELSKVKLKLYTLIARTFPEYLHIFSNLYIISSLRLLHKYQLPKIIAHTRIDGLYHVLKKHSMGKITMDKTSALKQLAVESVGDQSDFFAPQIKSTIEMIWFHQNQISLYDELIKEAIDKNFPFILTMPGVSYTTAGIITGEIGDIKNFKSFDALLAYAGMDPVVYQSGNYNASNTKSSKRGSPFLRWAIHHVSRVIIRHDDKFKAYYQKKHIEEHKHYYVCLGHVGKKVLRVLYSLLKYRQAYITQ